MSSLPLIERAREDGVTFVMSRPAPALAEGRLYQIATSPTAPRIPDRALLPGEQYRFHFDMTKCIGCKCCVVACNEQNGNPATINWRRVGEIEGGCYPNTQRFYLSMGCNHCLEPSCLRLPGGRLHEGPGHRHRAAQRGRLHRLPVLHVELFLRRAAVQPGARRRRQVRHVPRPAGGRQRPACVDACPEGAIQIEIVNIEEWKRRLSASANAPGLPSADDSISTTRITLPENLPPGYAQGRSCSA